MKLYRLGEILPVLEDKAAVLAAVKQGFISHAKGEIVLPNPMQMLFERADKSLLGDCHIKAASSENYPYFCVKMATGFYDNPAQGLPVNNGLVMLVSSQTGEPVALFQDEGYLTSVRTAAAGALAAGLAKDPQTKRLGIIGTGHQAELQARWISGVMDIEMISIWGRSAEKANDLAGQLCAQGLAVRMASTLDEVSSQSDILVTTTPSTEPILMADHVREGQHIIAMGADSPGKRELDPQILAQAETLIADDPAQCFAHGELGWAVRAGLVPKEKPILLGAALSQARSPISGTGISVVDLTGLGAQDLALVSFVYQALNPA